MVGNSRRIFDRSHRYSRLHFCRCEGAGFFVSFSVAEFFGGEQEHVGGGHGRWFVNTHDRAGHPRVRGAIVYGPLDWPGDRFGVLLGGRRGQSKMHVIVEAQGSDGWSEIARLARAHENDTLYPHLKRLKRPAGVSRIRVRIEDDGIDGYLMADALTFIDVQ